MIEYMLMKLLFVNDYGNWNKTVKFIVNLQDLSLFHLKLKVFMVFNNLLVTILIDLVKWIEKTKSS